MSVLLITTRVLRISMYQTKARTYPTKVMNELNVNKLMLYVSIIGFALSILSSIFSLVGNVYLVLISCSFVLLIVFVSPIRKANLNLFLCSLC